jgi:beta-galactosidase
VPADWEGAGVQLVFDAALQYTEVYLNGQHITDHRGGYTRFVVRLDNSSALRFGNDENVITVRTDCRWGSGHW